MATTDGRSDATEAAIALRAFVRKQRPRISAGARQARQRVEAIAAATVGDGKRLLSLVREGEPLPWPGYETPEGAKAFEHELAAQLDRPTSLDYGTLLAMTADAWLARDVTTMAEPELWEALAVLRALVDPEFSETDAAELGIARRDLHGSDDNERARAWRRVDELVSLLTAADPVADASAALVRVVSMGEYFAREWKAADELRATHGAPKPLDFPSGAEDRQREAEAVLQAGREAMIAGGEDADAVWASVDEGPWPEAIADLSRAFGWFLGAIDAAIDALPRVASLMDVGEPRPPQRWTARVRAELVELKATANPVAMGADGLGIVRTGNPLPPRLVELVNAIVGRRNELTAVAGAPADEPIPASVTAPPVESPGRPRSDGPSKTEAAALRRLAERPVWPVTELPPGIDTDALRLLSARGWARARRFHFENHQRPGGPDVPVAIETDWFCPVADPPVRLRELRARGGPGPDVGSSLELRVACCDGWPEVLADNATDDWHRAAEVKLTEAGRAARATLNAQSVGEEGARVQGSPPGAMPDSGGAAPPVYKPGGWTKGELIDQAKENAPMSGSTFDNIREAAGLKAAERGGGGQQRRFSQAEVRRLIDAVEGGSFRNRSAITRAWRELVASQ